MAHVASFAYADMERDVKSAILVFQTNLLHVSGTFFSGQHVLLFQKICTDAGHKSKNTLFRFLKVLLQIYKALAGTKVTSTIIAENE